MKIQIGVEDKKREGVIGILSQLLADEYVLYTKTRNFHWNVTGPHFAEYHKLFEEQYKELEASIDEVAERARTLGGNALGSMKEFLAAAKLEEVSGKKRIAEKMLSALLEDHEAIIQRLRKNIEICDEKYGDAATTDFLTGLMEKHEKTAWMLRSHLE